MESLSCATPVVAFNIGGNGDMIEHKVNGYLAKEEDDADLAEGILWCLENNVDNCLGNAGRGKVLQKYTFETVCQQYKSLYESVI
jgi:glycosyltransferase involved in cell wall biosynthesis